MTRTKIIISTLLATIFLATQVIAVGAAPALQESTPITVNVDSITLETDAGVTTVVVRYTDEFGVAQTLRLSLKDAIELGLVTDDGSGPVVNNEKLGLDVEINPTLIIMEEEEDQHPVGSALSDFFSDLVGIDYDSVMSYHDDGVGFGVIAQALWMTHALEGDAETFSAILEAKRTKDFSAITLPDGSTPTNWGQFRKAVMGDREKSKENLGAVMSGRANGNQEGGSKSDKGNNGKGNPNK